MYLCQKISQKVSPLSWISYTGIYIYTIDCIYKYIFIYVYIQIYVHICIPTIFLFCFLLAAMATRSSIQPETKPLRLFAAAEDPLTLRGWRKRGGPDEEVVSGPRGDGCGGVTGKIHHFDGIYQERWRCSWVFYQFQGGYTVDGLEGFTLLKWPSISPWG